MINPADALAIAPVVRFAILLNLGSEDEEKSEGPFVASTNSEEVRRLDLATCCRSVLRLEKYRAEPTPVRITDGTVPRHSFFREFGPANISRNVKRREVEWDCCTRVLRRSMGWSKVAETQPVTRPAEKWNTEDKSASNVIIKPCQIVARMGPTC